MASCYKTSDNRYFNCAPIMQDGRQFTDYRPNCHINNSIVVDNGIQNTYQYRLFLQRNANKLMGLNKNYNKRMADCNVCENTMLDEQTKMSCNSNGCKKTINNINGLGQGRDYGSIDRVYRREVPTINPPNNCRPNDELFNYYHTLDYNLKNDVRYTVPGSGSVTGNTDYSQYSNYS